jgi:hypothetical protein
MKTSEELKKEWEIWRDREFSEDIKCERKYCQIYKGVEKFLPEIKLTDEKYSFEEWLERREWQIAFDNGELKNGGSITFRCPNFGVRKDENKQRNSK